MLINQLLGFCVIEINSEAIIVVLAIREPIPAELPVLRSSEFGFNDDVLPSTKNFNACEVGNL